MSKQGPIHLNQSSLVIAIITEVCRQAEEQGIAPDTIPRQMNTVINAANDIVAVFRVGYTPAARGGGIDKWLLSDDVGMSSLFMLSVCFEADQHFGQRYTLPPWVRMPESVCFPHDPSDLNRCVKLLEACHTLRLSLNNLKAHGPQWEKLVDNWFELESLILKERAGEKTDLYERMKSYGC